MVSGFLDLARERGYIKDTTDEAGITEYLTTENASMYIGFDCTAPSLHIGSLIQIMLLRLWQKCGLRPIILLGGGTTKVGDPSGKDKTRQQLSLTTITDNMRKISKVFSNFLDFSDPKNGALIVDNAEWLDKLGYIEFLRNYGLHFSVNKMLSLESIKQRLSREQELSFMEFNYVLMQSYDFVKLSEQYSCRLQAGGSDQWGNIVNGVELNRRLGNPRCYGITTPLLTTGSGQKMGKTHTGAVWLDKEMFAPYDYWQYLRNTEDQNVGMFLRLFTELPIKEINKLAALKGSEINEAKKILATEATAICHGRSIAMNSAETAKSMFESNKNAEQKLHVFSIAANEEIYLKQLICAVGFASSSTEAKKLIQSNSVLLNDMNITDENCKINPKELPVTLAVGKKKRIQIISSM